MNADFDEDEIVVHIQKEPREVNPVVFFGANSIPQVVDKDFRPGAIREQVFHPTSQKVDLTRPKKVQSTSPLASRALKSSTKSDT